MTKNKTFCLVMIVRNEAKVIERCLNRVKDHIDYWVIVDTGSDDNTPELIQQTLAGIPGELHHRAWVNFGVNRTESLQLAKGKADYLLLCDADEQIIFADDFDKNSCNEDIYLVEYTGSTTYSVPYLIKGNIDWRYVGVTHEYLDTDKPVNRVKLQGISILDLKDGGFKQDKYERDIRLLEQGLIDEPNNARYKFYLANSYRDIQNYKKAAEWYLKRIEAGGWIEEVTCAYENLGKCYEELGDKQTALHYWLLGYDYNPNRAECLYNAVRLLRCDGKTRLGYQLGLIAKNMPYPKNDILFVKSDVYHYWIYYELSICTCYVGDFKLGYECCEKVLLTDPHNDIIVGTTINNLQFYKQEAVNFRENLAKVIGIIEDYLVRFPQSAESHKETLEYLRNISAH